MYRGTTPTFRLTFPIDIASIKAAYISFSQKDLCVVEKTLDDCEIEGSRVVRLKLTQKDTLKFDEGIVKCQARILLKDSNDAVATKIITLTIKGVLKEGVIA